MLTVFPMSAKQLFFKRFWSLIQGGMSALIFLFSWKRRPEVKINFAHFGGIQQILNFECSFWQLFFDVKWRNLNFFEKISIFRVSEIFWKGKLLCVRGLFSRSNSLKCTWWTAISPISKIYIFFENS